VIIRKKNTTQDKIKNFEQKSQTIKMMGGEKQIKNSMIE